jgi:hypothetical protein
MIEAVWTSEIWVYFNKSTQHYIPESWCENLKSHLTKNVWPLNLSPLLLNSITVSIIFHMWYLKQLLIIDVTTELRTLWMIILLILRANLPLLMVNNWVL